MTQRSYRQICGLAQALDLIGERWTLLILRELLLGPKRFGALRGALPGINANLLAERLRKLVDAGIVEPVELPAPATGVSAYALTERGTELREPIESLTLWGMQLLEPEQQAAEGWVARGSLLAASRMAEARRAGTLSGLDPTVVNASVDGEAFVIAIDKEGEGNVRHGAADRPDATLDMHMQRFYEVLAGRKKLAASDVTPRSANRPVADLLGALSAP